MTEHTPAPWTAVEYDGKIFVNGVRGFVCTLDQPPGPERQANLSLILAAPGQAASLAYATDALRIIAKEARKRPAQSDLYGMAQAALDLIEHGVDGCAEMRGDKISVTAEDGKS